MMMVARAVLLEANTAKQIKPSMRAIFIRLLPIGAQIVKWKIEELLIRYKSLKSHLVFGKVIAQVQMVVFFTLLLVNDLSTVL
jgi:hypothetical protein